MAMCPNQINLSGRTGVDVVVGDEMTASGPFWGSVGIDFACEISDTSIVKLVGSKTTLDHPVSNMPGSDEGTRYLTFRAVKPGRVKIKFFEDYRGRARDIKYIKIKAKKSKRDREGAFSLSLFKNFNFAGGKDKRSPFKFRSLLKLNRRRLNA